MNTLNIKYTDLSEDCRTTKQKEIIIKASNPHTLNEKYLKAEKELNIWVEDWTLTNDQMSGGNKGINAGSYLYQTLEELTQN